MKHLTAKDIADELDIGITAAYEVAKQCKRIVIGRSIRVSRAAFEAWKRRHEHEPVVIVVGGRRRVVRPPPPRPPALDDRTGYAPGVDLGTLFGLAQGISIESDSELDKPPRMRARKVRPPE